RIRVIESPSHPIRSEIEDTRAVVSFSQGSAVMDRDFVLSLELAETMPLIASQANFNNRDHLLLEFRTDLPEDEQPLPRLVDFVIDCSGSMGGESIAEARRAVELCIRSLNEGDLFQIVCFGSSFRFVFDSYLPFNQQTLEQAVKAIAAIDADMGGTELLAPLQAVLGEKSPGLTGLLRSTAAALLGKTTSRPATLENRRRTMIIMTDGEVSNDDAILDYVRLNAGNTRIFSFGIGAGASHYLVKGLARQSRGAAEFIFPGERIEPKVLRQFGRIDTPLIEEVAIDWGGLSVEMAPQPLPTIFSGEPVLIAARLSTSEAGKGGLSLVLSGKVNGKPHSWPVTTRPAAGSRNVALTWARLAIRDLEEGTGTAKGSNQKRGQTNRALKIAKEYGLTCRDASWVAIEQRSAADKTQSPAELRRVPVMVTSGWHDTSGGKRGVVGGGILACLTNTVCAQPMSVYAAMPTGPKKSRARVVSEAADVDDGFACAPLNRAADVLSTKSDPKLWYLDLLQQQKADGSFTCTPLLESLSNVPLTELKAWASGLDCDDAARLD
ncbi:MAG TPA: VWA domain-containing protein, partial [Candidatus Ozemobacteraceae bacterium]|nr:VWA domain-containing protein [Candidatus Ozemobacteraceae bacterium]